LKSELITLKGTLLQLRDVVQTYVRIKEKYYNDFLVTEVDFGEERILSETKIKSVEFKNLVINLLSNEQTLNELFDKAYGISLALDGFIEKKLADD